MSLQSTNFKSDDHKSDTDSGRSSIHCEKEIIERILIAPHKLRVTRCTDDKLKTLIKQNPSKVGVIGMEHNNRIEQKNYNGGGSNDVGGGSGGGRGQLLVSNRRNHILKKRNLHRRNTIELSHFNGDWQLYQNSTALKVTDCDTETDTKSSGIGASLPGNTHTLTLFLSLSSLLSVNKINVTYIIATIRAYHLICFLLLPSPHLYVFFFVSYRFLFALYRPQYKE